MKRQTTIAPKGPGIPSPRRSRRVLLLSCLFSYPGVSIDFPGERDFDRETLKAVKQPTGLHYAPIQGPVIGEAPEIFPYLGASRLMAVIDRHGADLGASRARAPWIPVHTMSHYRYCKIRILGVLIASSTSDTTAPYRARPVHHKTLPTTRHSEPAVTGTEL